MDGARGVGYIACAMSAPDYVLGTDRRELERLALQQDVWGAVTERFLERAGIAEGHTVVDLGCGPGFVSRSLAARVGPSGRVIAVDESERYLEHLAAWRSERGVEHLELRRARLEELELAPGGADLLFARWVFSFVPDVDAVIARLAGALRPGGVFLIEDYNHEGISIFPRSLGFDAVVRATRALYASRGGDAFVAARVPGAFRRAGLELVDWTPHVLSGDSRSPAFRWADAFFPPHSQGMVDKGLMTSAERERFLEEWEQRKRDPDARFFSPIVVDMAARKRAG